MKNNDFALKIVLKNKNINLVCINNTFGSINRFGKQLVEFLRIFTVEELILILKDKKMINFKVDLLFNDFKKYELIVNDYVVDSTLKDINIYEVSNDKKYIKVDRLQRKYLSNLETLLDLNLPLITYNNNEYNDSFFKFIYTLDLNKQEIRFKVNENLANESLSPEFEHVNYTAHSDTITPVDSFEEFDREAEISFPLKRIINPDFNFEIDVLTHLI